MNNQTKTVLLIGIALLSWGLFGSQIKNIVNNNNVPVVVDVLELSAPSDKNVKKEAQEVVDLLRKSSGNKNEYRKLRDLSLDLGQLIKLDGEDMIIKNTDEIRQANSLSGIMLRLDVKGKYANLAKEAKEVIVASIGDDNINLTPELRVKAVDGFNALAWAYNEASK